MTSPLADASATRPRAAVALLAAVTAAALAFLPLTTASPAPTALDSARAPAYGIWSDSTVPAVPSAKRARGVTLGLVFSSATTGRLRGVQYYAAGANRRATTGSLWNASGRRIASVSFPRTTRNGWKTAWLRSPVKIRAGKKYTVSYRAPKGRHAVQSKVFVDGRTRSANGLTAHRGTFGYDRGRPTKARRGSHYFIDVVFAPRRTTSTTTPTPTTTPTSTPTGVPVPAHFPTPTSVGPATEPTATYGGDCYFDASESNLVIDSRIVDCGSTGVRFAASASGIVFRNSVIRGQMFTAGNAPGDPGADNAGRAPVFTVENSRIIQSSTANAQDRALCCAHFVVRNSLVQGTHSGLWAYNNATLVGNYITTDGTDSHSSGMRVLKNTTLRDNPVVCKPVTAGKDGGCSAAAVFYREFGVTQNLTIEHNFFKLDPVGGPWFATRFAGCNTVDDCVNIRFTGNLLSQGWGTDGGEFPNDAGDVWSGNYWTDGAPALSDQSR